MTRLGTSSTKSEQSDTLKAFATFGVAGGELAPGRITRILRYYPTLAYAKGTSYTTGPRSPSVFGRTGMWNLSTDRFVAGDDLAEHLEALVRILFQPPEFSGAVQLRQLIEAKHLEAFVGCFWHGRPGAKKPNLPDFVSMFEFLPAKLEIDFATDDESGSESNTLQATA